MRSCCMFAAVLCLSVRYPTTVYSCL
jgi:hypothetical protein